MSLKLSHKKIKSIKKKFLTNSNFKLEVDLPDFNSFLISDIMISDWSGVALEFAFAFEKPILYIDSSKKIHNPDFGKIPQIPIEISIREKIGKIILPSEIRSIPNEIEKIKQQLPEIKKEIKNIRENKIFNVGSSEKIAVKQIIKLLNELE